MKQLYFYITLTVGTLALVLTFTTIVLGKSASNLQKDVVTLQTEVQGIQQAAQQEFQAAQQEINKGNQSMQFLQSIARDLAEPSLKDEKIKKVLADNGITFSPAASATPAPAPAPTPSATPVQ